MLSSKQALPRLSSGAKTLRQKETNSVTSAIGRFSSSKVSYDYVWRVLCSFWQFWLLLPYIQGPSGNLFPASASVSREFCSLGPCLLAGCSSSMLSTLGIPLLSPTRQGLGPTPCQGMHKAFEPPQEFSPSFICRFWGGSGFWGVCFPIFFYFLWLLSSAFVLCVQEYRSVFHFPD